ncbi:hypothetical protein [Synechococcus sp. W70.1]|uniref:hypothetical protein n=1 Tax=Synechococcus sp. W70.1 TaxID=2964534 RepID=UPI0039C192AA
MKNTGDLEFKVQVLARCLGSALGLGRPLRVQIHYRDLYREQLNEGKLEAGVGFLVT